jgi:hypothetical protein
MDDWLDWLDYEQDDEFVIEPGKSYITFQGDRADIMYFLDNKKFYFFGHVYQETIKGIIPLAVSWYKNGKIDPELYDTGYNLVGPWVEPMIYTRYVYIYREEDEVIKTVTTEKPLRNISYKLLATKKVILTGL